MYHEELPFFSLLPRLIPKILEAKNFQLFAEFFSDVENTPPDEFPQVIFLEPAYTDAPHLGLSSDDHAPSAIKAGQEFLLEAYRAIGSEPALWNGMVAIITYDEHGGFSIMAQPVRPQGKLGALLEAFPPRPAPQP